MKENDFSDLEWRIADQPVDYATALSEMEARASAVRAENAPELVWLLSHPPLYTAGTSAKPQDLLTPDRFPVFETGRGGQYTYHGPGQRVGYVIVDLKKRGGDVRAYVHALEAWIIRTLNEFGVRGERRDGRVGIWVARGNGREDKIAAIGVRVRKWVTYHGIAINLDPDLEHFQGIVPCGINTQQYGVTSLWDLGHTATMEDLDSAMMATFDETVGALAPAPLPE